jgi:hypothetical protein
MRFFQKNKPILEAPEAVDPKPKALKQTQLPLPSPPAEVAKFPPIDHKHASVQPEKFVYANKEKYRKPVVPLTEAQLPGLPVLQPKESSIMVSAAQNLLEKRKKQNVLYRNKIHQTSNQPPRHLFDMKKLSDESPYLSASHPQEIKKMDSSQKLQIVSKVDCEFKA